MGLDQYGLKTREGPSPFLEWWGRDRIAYWRKHYSLQGWMCNLYYSKGGEDEFNCEYVEVTDEDLDSLQKEILTEDFYSEAEFPEKVPYDKQADQKFIDDAKKAISEGYRIFYYSSW